MRTLLLLLALQSEVEAGFLHALNRGWDFVDGRMWNVDVRPGAAVTLLGRPPRGPAAKPNAATGGAERI